MRIFVIGGNGMAGHMIKSYFECSVSSDVYYSIREQSDDSKAVSLDLTNEQSLYHFLKHCKPDFVINAAGILNDDTTKRLKEAIYINSLLPHKLASYGHELGFRLIHISTDCVFSGLTGDYSEDHPTDGTTVYAKTKSLGEVTENPHVTIRTSIIGPEIRKHGIGLFQWFMKQNGSIQGFKQVFWNGVTTLELAKAIEWIIHNNLVGLVHLSVDGKISKYDLLHLLRTEFNKNDIFITPNSIEKSDKTLVNTRRDFTYIVPEFKPMVRELEQWMKRNNQIYAH